MKVTHTPTFEEMHQEYKRGNDQLREKHKDGLYKEIVSNLSKDKAKLANIFLKVIGSTIEIAQEAIPALKLYYYNDAAATCHYVLRIAAKEKAGQFRELEIEAFGYLNQIQKSIVDLCGNTNELKPISGQADIDTLCLREQLQALRVLTKESLEQIEIHKKANEEEQYINKSAVLFKTIASGMEKYLATLYETAEGILGKAPCKYTVIGLGSMALRQMTPYSDLECAILTENDGHKHSDDAKVSNYFKNLSHLVNFMLINLGETIIPTSRFNLDLSEFIPQAVNFDLGGKTPLGRIEQDKPYELVQTVEGLLRYLRNEEQKSEHMDKNLPNILQKSCFVYGDKDLQQSYQEQAQEFLQKATEDGRSNGEVRAVRVLWEGVEEADYTKSAGVPKKIEGALQQFAFNAVGSEGKLFDVKQEIYRLPDRLIYNLGLIYGIQEESSWDTIDKLCELGKISPDGAVNLKKALTFATNLRLKTYEHYKQQKDTMDFSKVYDGDGVEAEELKDTLSVTFQLSKDDLEPGGALFEYYKAVLPLRQKLKEFCIKEDIGNKDKFFVNEEFCDKSSETMAEIHLRLLNYEGALKHWLEEIEALKNQNPEHPRLPVNLNNVGYAYGKLGQHELALQYLTEALERREKLLGEGHPNLLINLNNVGYAYGGLGQHDTALKYYKKVLEMGRRLFNQEHPEVVTSLTNMGGTYIALEDYELALQCFKEAREISKKVFGQGNPRMTAIILDKMGVAYEELDQQELALQCKLESLAMHRKFFTQHHPNIVTGSHNLGIHYRELGRHNLALQYHEEVLDMNKKLLGRDHPQVAACLDNLGAAYGELGLHKLAWECHIESLEIRENSLGPDHPHIATSLNNIGHTYGELGEYELALQYQLKSLKMNEKLGTEHSDIAINLHNIGNIYGKLGQPKLALHYHKESLEMRKNLFGAVHLYVEMSLDNIGLAYNELGQHELALQYQLEALEMCRKLFKQEHPHTASTLNNLGLIYNNSGQHEQALQCQLEALEVFKISIGQEHPSIVVNLNNIGNTCDDLNQYELALKYRIDALEMRKKLLGDKHPSIAKSLNDVGYTYNKLGQYEIALQCHMESLEMRRELLGQEHLDVVTSLDNIGYTYGQLGQHMLALDYRLEALRLQGKLSLDQDMQSSEEECLASGLMPKNWLEEAPDI